MADHPYSRTCGCPGCQFMWAAEETYKRLGPPPVIGTFEPINGDIARDGDYPRAQYRVWTGTNWHPNPLIFPIKPTADET